MIAMIVLNDGDIGALMQVGDAVLVMREALAARSHGQMISPGREGFQTGKAGLVWTPGGFLDNPIMGLRLYPTGVARDDQLAALWDAKTRELLCAAVGSQ
jgi:hypothetical protein